MRLRWKALVALGLTAVGLIIVLSVVSSAIIVQNYKQLETEQTRQNVSRAVNTMERDIDALRLTVQSWAAWDNSREFILGERPNYPLENNLDEQVTETLRLNMMLFFDNSGEMVYGLAADIIDTEVRPVPASLHAYLQRNAWIFDHHGNPRGGHTGVVLLPEGPLLVAAQPISSSTYESIVGTLIAARFMDEVQLAHLRRLTELEIHVFPWDARGVPAHVQQAHTAILAGEDIVVQPLSDQEIAGYMVQRDFAGEPAFLLQVVTSRPIHQTGQTSLVALLAALLVAGIIFCAITVLTMERLVLRRLLRLSTDVVAVSDSRNDTLRLTVREQDELGELAQAINHMLESLEAAHRREREQDERVRQKMAEANALKTRFIANMSHELRTPLNSIINFTYIIKSGLRGPVTEEQLEYLNRVQVSGEHLLGMINDILDLSKIESGRMELHTEEIEFGTLVRSTLASATGLIKDKPVTLHEEIAEDVLTITVDKTRMRQVLLNLLSNAAKFTDAGTITVRVWCASGKLFTSVTDTGIGIAADKLTTIFEEFRQADEGSDRSYEGTGLGLPISRRLIELHGGHIWVQSTPGVGSTFTFSLPMARAVASAPAVCHAVASPPQMV